jgi:hypothetical protein
MPRRPDSLQRHPGAMIVVPLDAVQRAGGFGTERDYDLG